ncbi:MAG: tRNA preQ1(34) S-adenosylmethionine ribosyltransferase-isomerase QueA [Isosphaeraceae bacterium]
MFTSAFDFTLPDDLIAQHPQEPRDGSRLMVVNRQQACWHHRKFADLPDLLDPGDLLVRNNTQVVPARLVGRRVETGGKWEGLFLCERSDGTWEVLAKTRGRPRLGEHVMVGQGLDLRLEARDNAGKWSVRPLCAGGSKVPALELLQLHGQTPLPPYIKRERETTGDRDSYQTVYAQRPGSVAAPTAGLHFTEELFARLAKQEITWVDLTLHVGLGTFHPIESEQLKNHTMHAELAELSPQAVATILSRQQRGGRVVAVGTTSARVLETAVAGGALQPFAGETRLFIQPGHEFRGFDALITNFHLPRSSLFILVSAFAGLDLVRAAYAEAIRCRYRFFSYGDAMLIL